MSEMQTLLETLCRTAEEQLDGNPEQVGFVIICGDKTGTINLRSNMPMHQVMVALATMVQKQTTDAAHRIFQLESTLTEHAPPGKTN